MRQQINSVGRSLILSVKPGHAQPLVTNTQGTTRTSLCEKDAMSIGNFRDTLWGFLEHSNTALS